MLQPAPTFGMSTYENANSEDCLLKQLENLNVVQLMEMSRADNSYKDLITKRIIGNKLLNLSVVEWSKKEEILKIFGKSMAKFINNEMNFNDFLDTVMKYCSPAKLAQVELNLIEPVTVHLAKIEQSMPFFTNLNKIKLNCVNREMKKNGDTFVLYNFLERLFVVATNLQSLQLNCIVMGDVITNQLKNLQELRLIELNCNPSVIFNSLICNSPNLKTFLFKGVEDIACIINNLPTYCPKLKNFTDIHIHTPHHQIDLRRYFSLSSFSQLITVTLTSYTLCGSDLYATLVELAPKNIQKLGIFINLQCAVAYSGEVLMQSSFAGFRRLRELEVYVHNNIVAADLQCDFIINFAKQLKNLDTFSLKSGGTLANANKIIELLPKINKLSIAELSFAQNSVQLFRIVNTLRRMQQALNPRKKWKRLKLIVNMDQWKELQVLTDENLMEVILDPVPALTWG